MADQILVVTGTLGDSCSHLSRCLTELRQFTRVPFHQIVCDDGTADAGVKERQRSVCHAHGAEWLENPGPTFGISYNLNFMFEEADKRGYEWVFLLEDAVRPGQGWLETAVDALQKLNSRSWGGKQVGAIGMTSSYEAWHLACAGALPTCLGINEFFDGNQKDTFRACYDAFWGSANHPHWNDGMWCWQRMHAGCLLASQDRKADGWPEIIRRTWRDPILRNEIGAMKWVAGESVAWQEVQGKWGYQSQSGWPRTRGASWGYGPSAWGWHNLKAWRQAGRFRDGCTFYEGHLGVRLAKHGWLSVNCECPPWLHWSGLAFKVKDEQRTPRHHEPPDGPGGILVRDFGVNGPDHVDLANLARSYFGDGELDKINEGLRCIDLYRDPAWEKWL